MLSPWIAVIAACFACTGAAWVYFMAYDLRFRLDSVERSLQGMWKRLGNVEQKDRSEVEDLVREILTQGEAEKTLQPDVGEQMLMMLLQQSMQGATQAAHEPQDRFEEIDALLYGNGGDRGIGGDYDGETDPPDTSDSDG